MSPTLPLSSADCDTWRSLLDDDAPRACYVHIPFCRQRCFYCDFATGVGTAAAIEAYVQKLCAQIQQLPGSDVSLSTLFFGGGTPSLLQPEQLARIVCVLQTRFSFAANLEFSLEANPGTVDRSQLAAYREIGVNRISLGVQAFQPELLKICGRLHDVEAVYQTVEDLRAAGFDNINLDLIFGLPQQTMAQWQYSLQEAIALAPTHLSTYDLTVEPDTRFGQLYRPGDAPLPSDETTVDMYLEAITTLERAGYEHYEISNFARPDRQCRHNRVYWESRSYYGLGMGAAGYIRGQRYLHPRTLTEYVQLVDDERIPEITAASLAEQMTDELMVGLRLREGIALSHLEKRYGRDRLKTVLTVLEPHIVRGWVSATGDRLRLIPPRGWLFSNVILVDIMEGLET
ncbi:MAG: radical SAM family heme chaperone HemW [Cyanobacteria bacterium P01_F01_bin.33]